MGKAHTVTTSKAHTVACERYGVPRNATAEAQSTGDGPAIVFAVDGNEVHRFDEATLRSIAREQSGSEPPSRFTVKKGGTGHVAFGAASGGRKKKKTAGR